MTRQRIATALLLVVAMAAGIAAVPTANVQAADPFNQACTESGGKGTGMATVCDPNNNAGIKNPLTGDDGVLTKVANLLAMVGGVIVVIMIIIGGIKYVTSNGDGSQIASAKSTIIYGLIGLVVIALARVVVGLIVAKL